MQHEIKSTDLMDAGPDNLAIQDALGKCLQQVRNHERITASLSGGWDSDILADMIIRCGGKEKTTFAFFNTGLEYKATKEHIKRLNEKYGIEIQVIPPTKPIPRCVKEHGVPFWSKHASEMIMRLQKHGFKWEDEPLEVLLKKYPRCRSALRWWCNDFKTKKGGPSRLNIEWAPWLKEFMIENPPPMRISSKCCTYAKKDPAAKFLIAGDFDLECTGVRKAEGGSRSTSYTTCFTQSLAGPDYYRPLFWLSNADREAYDEHYGLEHSDCYKVWGMKRTGCAGCPFGKDFEEELQLAKKYEPNFYRAANKVFGESYDYTRKYLQFREEKKKLLAEARQREREGLFPYEEQASFEI